MPARRPADKVVGAACSTALAFAVFLLVGCASGPSESDQPVSAPPADAAELFGSRPRFGVSMSSFESSALSIVSRDALCEPTIHEFFVSLSDGVSREALANVPDLAMISFEPWSPRGGPDQPEFSLQQTISGRWDELYRNVATTVAAYGKPVLIRFAHEMNGDWYPWGDVGTNTPEQFALAWQHVVRIFRSAGAANALWVWSPNILRGTDGTPFAEYYPGDSWVDLVGLTGYGVLEQTAAQTYDPSMAELSAAAPGKKILITETGVGAGAGAGAGTDKPRWIESFGQWLAANSSDVVGFVWFQTTPAEQANADWRFNETPESTAAFQRAVRAANVQCG